MAALNVLVLVGGQLFLLEGFLPFALCAASHLSMLALRCALSDSLALRLQVFDTHVPGSFL